MKVETTPEEITKEIIEFCREITSNNELPTMIDVIPEPYGNELHCFENVVKKVNCDGGEIVNGWTIWRCANMFYEAEAHSVWRSTTDELIDITAHEDGEAKILFITDANVKYEGKPLPNKYMQLTDSLKIKKYIEAWQTRDKILSQYKADQPIRLTDETGRLAYIEANEIIGELSQEIFQKVGRNDPCPCGSGIKYKKCCLPYRV